MSIASISTVGKVIRGVSWDKDDAIDTPRPDYLPILRAGNIGNELNTTSDLVWVPASNVSAEQKIRAGDIAICMSSGSPSVVGKTASAKGDWLGSVGAFCALIRTNPEKCLPEYLALFLKSARFRKWTSEAQGANIKNIKKSALADFEVPVPPLPEQRRIVDLLSRAEGIVRLRREAERKAAELIPALFLDMFGDPATNPKGWPMVRLGDLAERMSDGPFGSNLKTSHYVEAGVRVIRLQNIGIGELIDDAKAYVSPEHFASLPRHRCLPDDVIIGTLGDPNLRAFVLPLTIPEALNKADCVQFRCRHGVVSPAYICWLMNMPSTLAMAASLVQGITLTRISMGRLREMIVPVPSFKVQQVFADCVEMFDSIKSQQFTAAAKAQATFDVLLAQTFS